MLGPATVRSMVVSGTLCYIGRVSPLCTMLSTKCVLAEPLHMPCNPPRAIVLIAPCVFDVDHPRLRAQKLSLTTPHPTTRRMLKAAFGAACHVLDIDRPRSGMPGAEIPFLTLRYAVCRCLEKSSLPHFLLGTLNIPALACWTQNTLLPLPGAPYNDSSEQPLFPHFRVVMLTIRNLACWMQSSILPLPARPYDDTSKQPS